MHHNRTVPPCGLLRFQNFVSGKQGYRRNGFRAGPGNRALVQKATAIVERDPRIRVTGTVPDIRPYLWESAVSIVPLRIGGGTRLKIYESMAAKIPVVSTTVGAEGLTIHPPDDIRIADNPQDFADRCLELLADASERCRMAAAAWEMVNASFSWEHVSRCFEKILERNVHFS
jgi:glycosyltransferase involved in cell wall biosynthesis